VTVAEKPASVVDEYLRLLRGCLTRSLFPDSEDRFDAMLRAEGRDWPASAETMIGDERLSHLEWCAREVLARGIDGDFLEAGVWRGGACILLQGVLRAFGETRRRLFVCDSFAGLPEPDPDHSHPILKEDRLWQRSELAVSLSEVHRNFSRYGMLDENVRFVEGLFKETLPGHQSPLALLRIDGDYYESTLDALTFLYPWLQAGGICIVDDFGVYSTCRSAVRQFLKANDPAVRLEMADWTCAFWVKTEQAVAMKGISSDVATY
jgi:O-methyltransferase